MKAGMRCCLWLSLTTCAVSAQTAQHPNIVLINIDDLGWSDLSCNGSGYYETPHIDRLRSMGVWFGSAYAGASNSAPSRACMLTGMNTPRHGMFTVDRSDRGRAQDRRWIPVVNRTTLPSGIQMLPQALRDSGYSTCHIGKWHVTADPLQNGMEVNIAGNHAGHPASYFVPYHNPNLADGPKGEFLMDRLGNEACRYLRRVDKSRPFFLYYAPYEVHTPLQAQDSLIAKYRSKKATAAHDNPVYAAMVEAMDRNVGKVLDQIQALDMEEQTLIIFTTDNGGVYDISKQWPLRAGKGSFYEGGIRVPLIIYQKGRFEKGSIDAIPVMQMDLFPTLLDCAGLLSTPYRLDGRSLLPLLNGDTTTFAERPLFWNFPGYLEGGNAETHDPIFRTTPVTVVRKGDWKLIQYYETDEVELFNLREDLSEKRDLSEVDPAKRREMLDLLNDWIKQVSAPIPTLLNPEYRPQ